jgi:hypothetical protein
MRQGIPVRLFPGLFIQLNPGLIIFLNVHAARKQMLRETPNFAPQRIPQTDRSSENHSVCPRCPLSRQQTPQILGG